MKRRKFKMYSQSELHLVRDLSKSPAEVSSLIGRSPASVYMKRLSLERSGKLKVGTKEYSLGKTSSKSFSLEVNGVNVTILNNVKNVTIGNNSIKVN